MSAVWWAAAQNVEAKAQGPLHVWVTRTWPFRSVRHAGTPDHAGSSLPSWLDVYPRREASRGSTAGPDRTRQEYRRVHRRRPPRVTQAILRQQLGQVRQHFAYRHGRGLHPPNALVEPCSVVATVSTTSTATTPAPAARRFSYAARRHRCEHHFAGLPVVALSGTGLPHRGHTPAVPARRAAGPRSVGVRDPLSPNPAELLSTLICPPPSFVRTEPLTACALGVWPSPGGPRDPLSSARLP